MKHSPAECEWGLLGDFFKAISPRSVKSYSHLGEIKDISVRGSWQGLSTARLASGFWFPTWIRCGGSAGAALSLPLPSAVSVSWCFLNPREGPGVGCARGVAGQTPALGPTVVRTPMAHAPRKPPGLESSRVSVTLWRGGMLPLALHRSWGGHQACDQSYRLSPPRQSPAPSAPRCGGREPARRGDGPREHPGPAEPQEGSARPAQAGAPLSAAPPRLRPLQRQETPSPWVFWGVLPLGERLGGSGTALGALICSGEAAKSPRGSVNVGANQTEWLGAERHGGIAPLPGCAPGVGPAPAGGSGLRQPLRDALSHCKSSPKELGRQFYGCWGGRLAGCCFRS